MRRRGHGRNKLGLILTALGAAIIVFLMLPLWAWWFLMGVTLLACGILILNG